MLVSRMRALKVLSCEINGSRASSGEVVALGVSTAPVLMPYRSYILALKDSSRGRQILKWDARPDTVTNKLKMGVDTVV